MATTFINLATNYGTSGTTLSCDKPTNTAQNDLMIAFVGFYSWGAITPPTGWNLITRTVPRPQNQDNSYMAYYKVAGASEPSSYTWTFDTTQSASKRIHISTYRGEFNVADPILGASAGAPYNRAYDNFISAMSGLNVIGIAGCRDTGGNSYTVGSGWTSNGTLGDASTDFIVNFSQFVTSANAVYGPSGSWGSSNDDDSFIAIVLNPSTLNPKDVVESGLSEITSSTKENSITYARPYLRNNDLILCFLQIVDYNTARPTVSAPSGFNLLTEHYGSTPYSKVYYKIANNEPNTYTFNFSTPSTYFITTMVYRGGINLSSPIETYSNTEYTVSNNIVRAGSITVQSPNTTLINFINAYPEAVTPATNPGTWTSLTFQMLSYQKSTRIHKLKWTGSGATGDIDSTLTSSYTLGKHAIALAIAPETTAPTVTTQAVSDITKDSATGNGNITATGGANSHLRGIAHVPASSGDISFIPLPNPSFEDSTLVWGGAGTLARSSEQAKYGTYSMKVSWSGGSEAYGEIHPTPATYSGKKITFSAWVWSSVANMACLNIYDNDGVGYEAVQSAYHPGDSTWRLLTVSKTLRSGLTDLILRCRIATGSANSAYFDGVLSPYSDSVSPTLSIDSGNYSTGAFTKALTDLTPNTDYRAVAFAQNSVGVGNGSTVGFTTLKADESNFFQLF